jgi:hypothetical protein
MTCSDCWTLLLDYLKYLLNINFEHVYIVFYSLNWLFWCGFYMLNDKPDGYPIPVWNSMGMSMNFYPRIWVWVRISIRILFTDRQIIVLSDPLPSLIYRELTQSGPLLTCRPIKKLSPIAHMKTTLSHQPFPWLPAHSWLQAAASLLPLPSILRLSLNFRWFFHA